jgi:O-Glycosyl hydrolase
MVAFSQTKVILNTQQKGRTFEGIGALSAGASTRLLVDYPKEQQAQILDYLFKPMYGLSLHHLKVEIGGDVNSTCGTEPSHARTREEFENPQNEYFNRGYEWWLMREAKKRNPQILLDALQWGAPGWVGNGNFYSDDNARFIASFVLGAKKYHSLNIDYVGIWNETPYNTQWIKTLSKELKRNSLSAKIVAADEVCSWNIAEDMKNDPELMAAVDVIGTHYPPAGSTQTAQNTGKSLWASEEGATMRDPWESAKHLIRRFNNGYIQGKIVKQVVWSVLGSYYDILPVPESGLLNARTPWNGDFQTKPVTWTVAHYTQFVQPGWVYLEGANGFLNKDKSSYVTLYNPKTSDYSMIIETVDYDKDQEIEVVVDKKLKQSKVYVWKTDIDASFVKVATITPKNGRFSLKLQKGSIYSLTTTTGQRKADDKPTTLSNKAFPFPYFDDFESYNLGSQPRYMSDQAGVFEVVNKPNRGKVLQQSINQRGIEWLYHVNPEPHTFVGDTAWRNYTVEVDVKLNTPLEHATIFGRLNGMYQHSTTEPNSYWFKIDGQGNWTLGKTLKAIQNGHYKFKTDWPEFYARFNNTNQSLQLSYNELMALPAADLAKFGKVAELIKADTDPEMLFVECLQWGMFDLRRRTELAKGQIPIDTNQWQNLKLTFQGKYISVVINNKSILTIRDTSYINGMVGLGSGYQNVMFDNFKVY